MEKNLYEFSAENSAVLQKKKYSDTERALIFISLVFLMAGAGMLHEVTAAEKIINLDE